jgi:hypothetical protein
MDHTTSVFHTTSKAIHLTMLLYWQTKGEWETKPPYMSCRRPTSTSDPPRWRPSSLLSSPSPIPPSKFSMACTISVRHGYGRSRGVHFSCTPPLGSRGVRIFLYASDNHSSYDLFPSSDVPDLLFSQMDRWWVRFRIFLRNYTAAKPFILPCYFTDELKGNGRPPYLSCRRRLALPIHLDGDHPLFSPLLAKPKIQVTSHALTARGSVDDVLVFIESRYGGNRVWILVEKWQGREGGEGNIFRIALTVGVNYGMHNKSRPCMRAPW